MGDFETAFDELNEQVQRLEGLMDFSNLSEMELHEAEKLKTLCERYLMAYQELEEREYDLESQHIIE